MSRIILSRHDNGEEHITIGFDRPLQHFFWSECDSDGESVDESYIDRGLTPHTPTEFVVAVRANDAVNAAVEKAIRERKLMATLQQHTYLEYPASNVVLDFTRKES